MSAEPEEGSQVCYLQPLEELSLGTGVRVRGLVWQLDGSWLVSDESGSLLKVSFLLYGVCVTIDRVICICGSAAVEVVSGCSGTYGFLLA